MCLPEPDAGHPRATCSHAISTEVQQPYRRSAASQRGQKGTGVVDQANYAGPARLVLELIVAGAAADRLVNRTPAVHGLPVLVVSGIAALVTAATALILRGDEDDSEGQAEDRDLSVAAVPRHHRECSRCGRSGRDGRDHPRHARLVVPGPAGALAFAVIVACHAVALIRKVLRRLRPATAESKTRT